MNIKRGSTVQTKSKFDIPNEAHQGIWAVEGNRFFIKRIMIDDTLLIMTGETLLDRFKPCECQNEDCLMCCLGKFKAAATLHFSIHPIEGLLLLEESEFRFIEDHDDYSR